MPEPRKEQLRRLAHTRRKQLTPEARRNASAAVQRRLFTHIERHHPDLAALLAYYAVGSEVDTEAVLRAPYRIYAPVTPDHAHMSWREIGPDTRWHRGAFGIPEPHAGAGWDGEASPALLVCPLVGFDRSGNRLGMGKGCFDRWLAEHRDQLEAVVGLAFACQELDAIPHEPHDVPLDAVVTEREVIACH